MNKTSLQKQKPIETAYTYMHMKNKRKVTKNFGEETM